MSKQLGFYLLNNDYDSIIDFIEKNNAIIIRRYNKTLPPKRIYTLNEENTYDSWANCIVLKSKVNELNIIERNLTDGFYYEIDSQTSPVIELIKSIYVDNTITRGRIYFQTRFYDKNSVLVKSDEETVALGNLLLNFIKKKFIKLDGVYKSYYSSSNIINNSYTLNLN